MDSSAQLRLHEEILLMALKDREGTVEWRAGTFQYALAGAILAELSLESRITIGSDRKKRVTVTDRQPLHDEILDDALARMGAKGRSAQDWVARIAGWRGLRHRVASALCRKGVLREEEGKILLIFRRKIYPTLDPAPERRVMERLRRAVTGATAQPRPRTAILLSLAQAAGLLRIYYDRQLLKENKGRIKQIANGELTGRAARQAVEAAQAAAAAAVAAISAATTATTVASR